MTADMPITNRTGPVKLSLRPEVLEIKPMGDSASSQDLRGVVVQRAYMGPVIEYSIKTTVGELFTRVPAYAVQFTENDEIRVHIRPEDIIIIPENDRDHV